MQTIRNLPKSLLESAVSVLCEGVGFGETTTGENDHPMIVVDGQSRHVNNADGSPIHQTPEGIRNFHRWFGDSKMVDEHGRPKVFYHGSNAHAYTGGEIEQFHTNPMSGRPGAFFSSSPDIARQYGEKVYPVYIRSSTPLNVHAGGSHWSELNPESKLSGQVTPSIRDHFQKKANEMNSLFGEFEELFGGDGGHVGSKINDTHSNINHLKLSDTGESSTDGIAKFARKHGYTSASINDVHDEPTYAPGIYGRVRSDVVSVFRSSDIKSTHNNGLFSEGGPIKG